METKKWLHIVSFTLVIVGALNWGLFGLFNFDLIEAILGGILNGVIAEIIYTLVGIAGVYLLVTHMKECTTCSEMGK